MNKSTVHMALKVLISCHSSNGTEFSELRACSKGAEDGRRHLGDLAQGRQVAAGNHPADAGRPSG